MRRALTLLLPLAFVALACDDSPTDPGDDDDDAPRTVAIDLDLASFHALGDTVQVSAAVLDESGEPVDDAAIVWSSLDELIATVDDDGNIVAVENGITRIVATHGGAADSVVVHVAQEVAAIEIGAPDSIELVIGDTVTFPVVAHDANGNPVDHVRFDWDEVDPFSRVAGVVTSSHQRGVRGGVIATAPGETVVRAEAPVYGVTDDIHVTVTGHTIDFALVSAGGFNTCGMGSDGAAYCWGGLYIGRIPVIGGFGTASFWTPKLVADDLVFDTIATGHSYACGIAEGLARCWGWNSEGELGDNTTISSAEPVVVSGSADFASIAVGQYHACGLEADGRARCWGANLYGQLGDSTLVDRSSSVLVGDGSLRFAHLSAGPYHTCGITVEGVAWCWGLNDADQLGSNEGDIVCETILGPHTCSPVPVQVETDGRLFTSIEAGGMHTCALDDAMHAFCWGQNDVGQLGTGEQWQGDTIAPQPVTGGRSFVSLSTTQQFTCGLTTTGDAYCWGVNTYGQLGSDAAQPCPTSWLTLEPCMPTPTLVTGGLDFEVVDTGAFHACAMTTAGLPYCWGENSSGQLGAGPAAPFASSSPLLVWGAE